MTSMKKTGRIIPAWLATAICAFAWTSPAAAQNGAQTGALEFVARVAPTGARPEPVREITFYLLRKSLAEIQKEIEATEPKPELDQFIDGLKVSEELKAWMKKQQSAELAGSAFIARLTVNDVLAVPEFYDAYVERNTDVGNLGFPTPKYRERDRQQNPQRYEQQKQQYREALRKYIQNNPQSTDGIDAQLESINPGPRWLQKQSEMRQRVRNLALRLAQTRYLAAKAESDLDGRGAFTGLAPGDYWLGTLDTEAVAGDMRLRWDMPVKVDAGQTVRVELSNINAVR